eukprot:165315-Rhodomonas_salina.1
MERAASAATSRLKRLFVSTASANAKTGENRTREVEQDGFDTWARTQRRGSRARGTRNHATQSGRTCL